MQAAADRPALSATHPSSSPSTASRHINQNPKTHLLLSFPLPLPGPRSDLRRRRHAEALPPCGNRPFILVTSCTPLPKALSLLSAEPLNCCSSFASGQEEGGECREVHHEDQGGQLPASQPCNLQVCYHHPISSVYYRPVLI